ncbi:hypothetical protein MMC31_006691, partial [Peltigera leucophlebia]|nr:hypothetical protein [Peltigera leucophlebia]
MAPMERPITSAGVNRDTLLGVLWAGVVLSLTFLLTRVYIRFKVFHKLSTDDYFLITAWVMALVNATIWQVRWKELYFGIAIASGQATVIPTNISTLVVNFLRSILGSYLVQYTALWGWGETSNYKEYFGGAPSLSSSPPISSALQHSIIVVLEAALSGVRVMRQNSLLLVCSRSLHLIVICSTPSATRSQFIILKLSTAFDVLTDVS